MPTHYLKCSHYSQALTCNTFRGDLAEGSVGSTSGCFGSSQDESFFTLEVDDVIVDVLGQSDAVLEVESRNSRWWTSDCEKSSEFHVQSQAYRAFSDKLKVLFVFSLLLRSN